MKYQQIYFCLDSDGLIHNLGSHGDYETADGVAESLGIDVIWLFGEDTAKNWVDTISHHMKEIAP